MPGPVKNIKGRILVQAQNRDKDETFAFVPLLRACAKNKDLCRGTQLHDDILGKGLQTECLDALVTMYAKCGALEKAKELFDKHKSRDVLTWTSIIAALTKKGQGQDALNYFERMRGEGLSPDAVTFTCVLKACGSIKASERGEKIHDEIAKQEFLQTNVELGNALVDMYVKCGLLTKAQRVLEELPSRDVISWTALITGYAQHGDSFQAMSCFEQMQSERVSPNAVTFLSVLKACGSMRATDKGGFIHDEIVKQGLLANNVALGTALVDMYAKCGTLAKAQRVLEELPFRDVVAWNALIAGYAQDGKGEQALNCFEGMQHEGLSPNTATFTCILKACGSLGAVDMGEKIHDEVAKQGLLYKNDVLATALIDMYVKCGDLTKAQAALEELPGQNVTMWNALIGGYADRGEGAQALHCYEQMKQDGLSPDAVTFICALKACGSIEATDQGEEIHKEVAKQGLLMCNVLLGNALVDMYVKCGALPKAWEVLEVLPTRNVSSWNAVIAGYALQCEGAQALNCYEQMQRDDVFPDAVTFACILKACGSVGAADKGKKIHDEIAKQELLGENIMLGAALVDMYAKCGALTKARQVLKQLPVRDVVLWSALISGYAQQGEGAQALECFEDMQKDGFSPDAATFSCVLSACSGSGLVAEALQLFVDMSTKYGLSPHLDHYTCIVDLFGRAGHLEKAVGVIEKLSYFNGDMWSAMLGACRKWVDVNFGRWAFDHAVLVDKTDAEFYVLMADIYKSAGMHEDAENIEALRMENKAWKKTVRRDCRVGGVDLSG